MKPKLVLLWHRCKKKKTFGTFIFKSVLYVNEAGFHSAHPCSKVTFVPPLVCFKTLFLMGKPPLEHAFKIPIIVRKCQGLPLLVLMLSHIQIIIEAVFAS